MSAGVRLEGLDDLKRFLTDAPADVRADAMEIVRDETEQAARDYVAGLPSRTGRLVRLVRTSYPAVGAVLVGIVRSMAPHSHLVDRGTAVRRTRSGGNRGRMPGLKREQRMSGIAPDRRARMLRRIADVLRARGFEVSGV